MARRTVRLTIETLTLTHKGVESVHQEFQVEEDIDAGVAVTASAAFRRGQEWLQRKLQSIAPGKAVRRETIQKPLEKG